MTWSRVFPYIFSVLLVFLPLSVIVVSFVSGNLYVAHSAGMYTDKIRRYSNNDNTTKILLNDEVIKLHAGDASDETARITNGRVGIGVVSTNPGHVLAVTSSEASNFAAAIVNTNFESKSKNKISKSSA